ncbi:MAG: hypothetical protein ACD_79C00770G0003 [uncultured bacterium]|nr:MAG: hypothetical protein ACD_79C00770G0003 [uncultured bacterium]
MLNITKNEFIKMSQDSSVIAIHTEFACDFITPVGFFSKINEKFTFLLESVECSENIGRYSFIGMNPKATVSFKKNKTIVKDFDSSSYELTGDPIENLKKIFKKYKPVNFELYNQFAGGAVGYLAYDIISQIEKIKLSNEDELDLPDLYFIIPKILIIFDHVKHTVKIVFNAFVENKKDADLLYEEGKSNILKIRNLFTTTTPLPFVPIKSNLSGTEFKSNMDKDCFCSIVNKAKDYIVKGDCIQVVLSQRFQVSYPGKSLNLYRSLRMINPSPYMFLINFPEFSLIGSSPEILCKEERKKVTIRPIAGTRKRGKNKEEDLFAEKDLLSDAKEIAEHVMLVDLGRNDIGRVCKEGTVKADELMVIERYSHVMHIVSNVTGELSDDKDAFDLIRATFPAGTVSGAPKIRAMEIIEELEKTKRGPYAGAVCYFDFGGNFDSCITIRTIVLKNEKAYIQAGAGIVYDSIDEKEYEETINKAKAAFTAIEVANSIEENKESSI